MYIFTAENQSVEADCCETQWLTWEEWRSSGLTRQLGLMIHTALASVWENIVKADTAMMVHKRKKKCLHKAESNVQFAFL